LNVPKPGQPFLVSLASSLLRHPLLDPLAECVGRFFIGREYLNGWLELKQTK
jgi:hypothetical protein